MRRHAAPAETPAHGLDLMVEFAGRRVLITGAGGTLGGWLTGHFARAGAKLGLSDIDAARLDAASNANNAAHQSLLR